MTNHRSFMSLIIIPAENKSVRIDVFNLSNKDAKCFNQYVVVFWSTLHKLINSLLQSVKRGFT